jgi:penicillin-binding protein 1B
LFAVAGIAAGAWYISYLNRIVTAKFHDPKWQIPSKIYSDSFLIIPGTNLRPERLQQKLIRLGYRRGNRDPKVKGEYRFLRNGGVIEVYLRDFDYPTGSFAGFPTRITLQGDAIEKIENTETGEELFSLELEPELVTGLYDRVWEQRKLVRLAEVPPLLVRAIIAVEDERFYSHWGIDPVAVLRASWANLRSGRIVQGGSTLTQQLMENFFGSSPYRVGDFA